ncbi:MAG: cation-translocating P-type ATPase, partial [Deltaproteobacteria bacterium]|nr:cation-translocating P-type ATPase [Deltaproteobacteria bacterium]
CPCAIGLATPLAYELAHLRLRRQGLLSRRAGLLDRARRLRHVVFDKTGTLTFTTPVLRDPALLLSLAPTDREALWQLAARSNHPKSRALVAALDAIATTHSIPLRLDPALAVVETPGVGLASPTHRLVGDGQDLVFSSDHELARLSFEEALRADAPLEVARLQALGLTVHIASGDAPDKVMAIARDLGVAPEHAHARLMPEAKADLVRRLGAAQTLVLGDGVNDVLAFEAAGLAGTPALDRATLPARADFVLVGQDLGPLAELVALARRTRQITWRNLLIAGLYNTIGLVAGLMGALTPLIAAVAMPLSSLIVLGLTLMAAHPSRDPLAGLVIRPTPKSPPSSSNPADPNLADPSLSSRSPTWMPST